MCSSTLPKLTMESNNSKPATVHMPGSTTIPEQEEEQARNLILLRWNDSESYLSNQIKQLWKKMEMTDVMLSCEGRMLHAHKIILSLWSPYFEQLFQVSSCPFKNVFDVVTFLLIIIELCFCSDAGDCQMQRKFISGHHLP